MWMCTYRYGKGKKVISKNQYKDTHRDCRTHTHAYMWIVDTGKMRNKIDMFHVKCRKNHTIRILTSIVFCEFWWWCDAYVRVCNDGTGDCWHSCLLFDRNCMKFSVKRSVANFSIKIGNDKKNEAKKEKQTLKYWHGDGDRAENKWVEFNELWSSNCNGYALLLLQIHKEDDCIPTGMQNVRTNESVEAFCYSIM